MTSWNNRTWADYCRSHKNHLKSLITHIKQGRCKKPVREKNALRRELWKSDAPFLAANNIHARLNFARIWLRLGLEFVDEKPCYFVTLAPAEFARSFEDVPQFDLRRLQSTAREALRGFDYIGNTEIGCYTNFNSRLGCSPFNSLHVHAFVVDPDVGLLRERIKAFSDRHESCVPGCPSGHAVKIKSCDSECLLLYMMKAPAFEYRVAPKKTEVVDLTTGEVFKQANGKYRQYKGEARRHTQLRIRKATAGWYLDKLIIAGGAGRAVLEQVRKEALKTLPRKMRSKRQHEFSGEFKQGDDS